LRKSQFDRCYADEAGGEVSTASDGVASSRREFLAGALAVSSVALAALPKAATGQAVPEVQKEVQKIGEIVAGRDGKLRATITVRNDKLILPADPALDTADSETMLRYLEGRHPNGDLVWPPDPLPGGARRALPGPTLRARVGDRVEITYLNHVKVDDFAGTLDRVERGEVVGCDDTTEPISGKKIYPEGADDRPPDCFHGSSTTNMHFHGTHVTPDGLGDNVLLQLRPNPEVTADSIRDDFARIFQAGPPARWRDLPKSWRERQLRLLQEYDDTAIWQGRRGTPGHPELPPDKRLLKPTEDLIKAGFWPQYQVGAYPFCYTLTKYVEDMHGHPVGYEMGQCPGTHWYHAHKHGSTAINVLNGMAGVFIIEGDYDDALVRLYPDLKKTERVLIVQNFSNSPRLTSQIGQQMPPSLWVNGQLNPIIKMRPGEIQLWRFVNASIRAVMTMDGFGPETDKTPAIRQIAQDGVQFKFENYQSRAVREFTALGGQPRRYSFAPGNRVDILVKAPLATGPYTFNVTTTNFGSLGSLSALPLLTLQVEGAPLSSAMDFPTAANYPLFPKFLTDIEEDDIRIRRRLDFSWDRGRQGDPGLENQHAPKFMIDEKQFVGGRYDQTMILGDVEEWTLTNSTSTIAHPFHIHINPFQVVEIFDPTNPDEKQQTYKPAKDFIWQDVIAIPPGTPTKKGYVKIRHRFADFPGSYVLHCHMLAHEDRGMMQLVRVIPSDGVATVVPHH
jgi:FtsP/CotA-like multicopper oxidase with cupredoxin domain